MKSKEQIAVHWNKKLIQMGFEIDYELTHKAQCFTCGRLNGLERAHIVPVVLGGGGNCDNIHVLCKGCHNESEMFLDDEYWNWYKHKRDVGISQCVAMCIKLGESNEKINTRGIDYDYCTS